MFRENIFEFTEMGTLFVPKNGGLYDYVFEMLPDMGMELESWMGKKEADGFKQDGLEIVLARGEDIPQRTDELICNQRSAFGLTGDDLFDEYMLSQTLDGNISPLIVLNTYDWFDENAKYNRPALCLMNKTGNFEDIPKNAKVAVNKKYENTSKVYLSKSYRLKNLDLRIESYNGDTEKTVADGTNNCCIEIVYSGKTVEENDLEIVDIVRFSDIVLVG